MADINTHHMVSAEEQLKVGDQGRHLPTAQGSSPDWQSTPALRGEKDAKDGPVDANQPPVDCRVPRL